MNLFRTRSGALALCVAAVVVAGCGSSSKSKSTPASPAASTPATPSTPSTGTTTTPSGGFAAQLNSLCKTANEAAKPIQADPTKLAALVEQYLPKFKALTPPAADKATYDKYLTSLEKLQAAFKAKRISEVQKIEAAQKPLELKLGAPACAA